MHMHTVRLARGPLTEEIFSNEKVSGKVIFARTGTEELLAYMYMYVHDQMR